MVRPRRSDGTKERLLEEGVAAFLERGYHGTGIQEVVDRVRVPKGSFYNYFDSKEAFGAAAIEHYAAGQGEAMAKALGGAKDPVSGLRRFFEGLMVEFAEKGYIGGCLVANLGGELEGSEVCRKALGRAYAGWRGGVRSALEAGQRGGLIREDVPAEELAGLLVDAWEGAVIRMKIERSLQPLRTCLDRLLDGFFRP